MDYYEIEMKGKFWLEKLAATPAYAASDVGRVIYQSTLKELYFADDTSWRAAGFPAGTKMLFYQDTAPTGWTIVTTVDDTLVYFSKGSSAGGNAGGSVKSASTWTQPNHTHGVTTGNHTHTMAGHTHTGPSHYHTTQSYALQAGEIPAHTHGTPDIQESTLQYSAGGGNADVGRPRKPSYGLTSTSQNTPAGAAHSHGNTGTEGTGPTGPNSASTDPSGAATVTSANGATAATWRPSGYCVIICTKN